MKKSIRRFVGALALACMALTACQHSGGGYDYVESVPSSKSESESEPPEMTITGLGESAGSDYDYAINHLNAFPGEASGVFTVYIQHVKPQKLLVTSGSPQIAVSQTDLIETTDSDPVGAGAWKTIVSYSASEDLALEEGESSLETTITVAAMYSSLDTVQKSVQVSVSYMPENEAYRLTDFVVSGQNEHVFTLSWTNPTVDGSAVTFTSITYKVYKLTSDEATGEIVKTLVETGTLDPSVTSLTTQTVIDAQSNYYVELTAVASSGWYTTNTEGTVIATTDDITPPNAPALTIAESDATAESVSLIYQKYTSDTTIDDTKYLVFAVTESDGSVVSGLTITATGVDVNGSEVTAAQDDDGEGTGLNVLSYVTGTTPCTIVIDGFSRANTAKNYTVTVHAIDALGNDSAATTGTVVNEEGNRSTVLTVTTVADTVPCANVTDAALDLSETPPALTWTAPADSDFACVHIYVGDSASKAAAVSKDDEQSASLASFAGASSITIKSVDQAGNESSGVTLTIPSAPTITDVTAGLTGQLVASLSGLDASGATYSVASALGDDTSAVLSGEKAYVSGLTVGSEATVKLLCTAAYEKYSVTYAVTASTAAKPTMTVWQLKNAFNATTADWYMLAAYGDEMYNSGKTVIATLSGSTATTDGQAWTVGYDRYIVWPGKYNGTEGYVTLELAKIDSSSGIIGAGVYLTPDDETTPGSDAPVTYAAGWSTGSKTYNLYAEPYTASTDGSAEKAVTFKVESSSYTDSYSQSYKLLQWQGNTSRYVRGVCYHVSALIPGTETGDGNYDNGGAITNKDYAWQALEAVWTGSESTDSPAFTADMVQVSADDHSLTLSWTDPEDVDFDHIEVTGTVTEYDGTTSRTVSETVASGVQTLTLSKLAASKAYSLTITAYDAFGNKTPVTKTVSTKSDSTAPDDVTALGATVGRSSVTLSWTASESGDTKAYKVYKDDTLVTTVTETTASVTDLTANTSYTFKVTACDYASNESSGVTLEATPVLPVASNVAVTPNYTGTLLVTWTDTTASETNAGGEALSYTYSVTCTQSGVEAQTIASGVQQAHFTGLTVGQEYSFTVTVVDSDSVTCGTTDSVSAQAVIVLWKLANTFEVDSKSTYAACWCPYITSSVTHNYIHTCDWSDMGMLFDYWIVHPSLSNPDDTEQFSLEASTSTAQETGYYMALDSSIAWTSSNEYITKGWWGDSYGKKESAHFHTETPDTIKTNTGSLAYASFKFVAESTCGTSVLSDDTFSKWYCMQVGSDLDTPYYVYDTALILSGETKYTVSSGDYAFAYKKSTFTEYGEALSEDVIAKLAVE